MKEFDNSLKEINERQSDEMKRKEMIKKKRIQDLKMEIEAEENTVPDNPENLKPREEERNYRHKHHQQNTRDGRQNLRGRRYD